jgi:hypothetical protein
VISISVHAAAAVAAAGGVLPAVLFDMHVVLKHTHTREDYKCRVHIKKHLRTLAHSILLIFSVHLRSRSKEI